MKWKLQIMIGLVVLLSLVPALITAQDKPKQQRNELRATATAHSVVLTWTLSPTACVQNTNVHRTLTPHTAVIGTNFAVVAVPTATYTDLAVTQGTTYYYSLSGWGAQCGGVGNESALGNEISATIPVDCTPPSTIVNGVCTAPPLPPTNLTGAPQ